MYIINCLILVLFILYGSFVKRKAYNENVKVCRETYDIKLIQLTSSLQNKGIFCFPEADRSRAEWDVEESAGQPTLPQDMGDALDTEEDMGKIITK